MTPSGTNMASASIVGHLERADQLAALDLVREIVGKSGLVRPSSATGQPMSVRVTAAGALGWTGDEGYRYRATDRRGVPWPPLPEPWAALASRFAGPHPWDSALINWYDKDASLGWHRDLAEADHTLPIVTLSIGDTASWAIRLNEESPVYRARLDSGDVTLLAGPTRLALHTIERLIPSPLLSPLSVPGRLSITIRCAGEHP